MTITIGGHEIIVDDSDREILLKYKWHAGKSRNKFYAIRSTYDPLTGNESTVKLHRELLNPPNGIHVDHINGNGLDNRRCNLRLCSPKQNARNRGAQSNNKHGYKGVYYNKKDKRWVATIFMNGKNKYLGSFITPEEASKAYIDKSLEFHGEFSFYNDAMGGRG